MKPWVIWVRGVGVPAYPALLMVAFGLGMVVSLREARRRNLDIRRLLDLSLVVLIGALAGSRVLHILADGSFWEYVARCLRPELANPPAGSRRCLGLLDPFAGGYVFYGGAIGAFLGGAIYLGLRRMPLARVADCLALGTALGLGVGRIGCFLAGCCYGKVCPEWLPVGVVFTDPAGQARPLGVALYPTQLAHAAANAGIYAWLQFRISPRSKGEGETALWFVLLYAVARFLNEFLRNDPRGALWGGPLSTSQGISLILALVSAAGLLYLHRLRSAGPRQGRPVAAI